MSLPATLAERSRAHFAHEVVYKRRRFKEGARGHKYINTWVLGSAIKNLKDDLVRTYITCV